MSLRRLRSIPLTLAKLLVVAIAALLVIVGIGIVTIETGWAKNALRDLLVRQANNYLTATLSIDRLEGSLLRGIQLGDVHVARNGQTLIHIDEISLSYSLRELFDKGVTIRRVRLTRPVVVGARTPEGGWDLAALVKRDSREGERTGPGRPIRIDSVEVLDGHVSLRSPLDFGAAHVPTDFDKLNVSFSFAYYPVRWTLHFNRASWIGHAPELSVDPLSGTFGRGPNGWFFEEFVVHTAQSAFTLDGTVNNVTKPTRLDLRVRADRFAFQEWAGVIHGLQHISVEASFDTSLKGPLTALITDLEFNGTGGSVKGRLTLDTSVPGWRGAGAVDVQRLNLARWLDRPDRPSDINGHVKFDLALELGRHFPRGVYSFDGPHVMFMNYVGDRLHSRGQLTADSVLIAHADALAYGAEVSTDNSSIGIDGPFPFHFVGTTRGIDLRLVPTSVPIPHVESLLTFDYDVAGRFNEAFIAGQATFQAPSSFLGASIGTGTVGTIDTSQEPMRYTGDGEVRNIDLRRFGDGLDVAWMRAPAYAGTVSGRFHVNGRGAERASLALSGGGHISRADLFKGDLSNADVSIDIDGGTLRATYDGAFDSIDPAIPFENPQIEATLTGTGRVTATVRDLLLRTVTLADYDLHGSMQLQSSTAHGVAIDSADVAADLHDQALTISRLDLAGPSLTGRVNGTVGLASGAEANLQFNLTRGDLGDLRTLTGIEATGTVTASGTLSGPVSALRVVGDATVNDLSAYRVTALTTNGHFDVNVPSWEFARATAAVTARASFVSVSGESLQEISGTFSLASERLQFDVQLAQNTTRRGTLNGDVQLHLDSHRVDVTSLAVSIGRAPWRLVPQSPGPFVTWSDHGFSISDAAFVDDSNDQRIAVSGTWRDDGAGALRVTASHVFLDTLQAAFEHPTAYGGALDVDVTISGTRAAPRALGTLTVTNGRVERVSYEKLTGRFNFASDMFDIDARLDQAPGVWVTAVGSVPLALLRPEMPERPINLTISSSTISLGLVEGLTDLVRNVTGSATINVAAIGTSRDPHISGTVMINDAGLLVTTTGAQIKNTRASLTLTTDKITVDSLHVEDRDGRPLDVHGSLGTHELRLGDLEIEGTASRFEIMRNELGRITLDAKLRLGGRLDAPRIAGDLTITGTSSLKVDEILERALFQPYATDSSSTTDVDAVRALNPWERLGLDISLHVPDTLRLTGDNVQISSTTPIGLGEINIKVAGDLYLYKDPNQPLSVTGSFDSVSGTYAFQGRRFDVDPASSINFRGDLNPDLYVTVTRTISAVQTRVAIVGSLREPELRLSSTPPLDDSDILSLIVFNTATNQLSASEQQQLLVRAGTLAAGFLATPILSAIEKEVGFGMLEIDPTGDNGTGPRVTVGNEFAPGLVARFSRQFGVDQYDEATIEYALSRVLRLRASYSDAQSTAGFAAFRRIERTGVDLIFFFSF